MLCRGNLARLEDRSMAYLLLTLGFSFMLIGGALIAFRPLLPGQIQFGGYARGELQEAKVDWYYTSSGPISAENPIDAVVWVTLTQPVSDENITLIRIIFDGSWKYPFDVSTPVPPGEARLIGQPRGSNIYRGQTQIFYPVGGQYKLILQVVTSKQQYREYVEETRPQLTIQSAETIRNAQNNVAIVGYTSFLAGLAMIQVIPVFDSIIGNTQERKRLEKTKETEP